MPQVAATCMLAKFYLHLNQSEYELSPQDLQNWDDIEYSYKRDGLNGVVRSFSSQFKFVNRAKDLLTEAYLTDGFNAHADFAVHTCNDNWVYVERFRCPLDFSTISWEDYTLTISSVDNNLAAMIKANKGTKYELLVGEDIPVADRLRIKRVPMLENLTYGFTQGVSYEDKPDIRVTFEPDKLPWVGNKGSEVVINRIVDWKDDQETDPDSYLFKIVKDVQMRFSYDYAYRSNLTDNGVKFSLKIIRGNETIYIGCGNVTQFDKIKVGDYASVEQLPDLNTNAYSQTKEKAYALVSGIVWESKRLWWGYTWENTQKTIDEYVVVEYKGVSILDLKDGDTVILTHTLLDNLRSPSTVWFIRSEFFFEWKSVGEDAYVDVISPANAAEIILQKIAGSSVNVHVNFSNQDARIAKTYLMAAESIREIPSAKFYSSFSELCDWMATVFGYIYYLGEAVPSKYPKKQFFGKIVGTPYTPSGHFTGEVDTSCIWYNSYLKRFFYATEAGYFATWATSSDYNDTSGMPRNDTVFFEGDADNYSAWVFPPYSGSGDYNPAKYDIDIDNVGAPEQTVYFVHRSELFKDDAPVRRIGACQDLNYSVDAASIYSSVTIGYDKKDYENINGRDEFNFNNTYSTGCTTSDKNLSLISKYRADCYGIEFALQKRSANTTDTSSDQDVFFTLCTKDEEQLVVDRDCEIENVVSEGVFNGCFSPIACVRANAGLIGLQAKHLTLQFTSSTGNSDVIIDGEPISGDIVINTPIATCGTVAFTTDSVDDIINVNELIEVESDGVTYTGYISEADFKYAKTEAAKYKLIVKEIRI